MTSYVLSTTTIVNIQTSHACVQCGFGSMAKEVALGDIPNASGSIPRAC